MTSRTHPARRHRPLLGGLVAAMALLGASCGESDGSDGAESSVDDGATGEVIVADVQTDPQDFRGEVGRQIVYDCPAAGTPATIWGTEVYTDDSSVCTAAVQVGLITFADGGEVTVEIAEGRDGYDSGVANQVSSTSYGRWEGSFTFPAVEPGSVTFEPSGESWAITAAAQGLEVGETFSVACAPDGEARPIWGSDTYTADSSICTAAVHSGLITLEDGGTVTIELTAGQDSYAGSEANGVQSTEYGSYGTSFTFPTS